MKKTIVISESAREKVSGKELMNLTNLVKSKKDKVGSSGVLKDNEFYKVIRKGFILF